MSVHVHAYVCLHVCSMYVHVCVCMCVSVLLERVVSFETGQAGSGLDHRLYSPFPVSLENCPWLQVGIICFFSSSFPAHFLGGYLHFIINNSGAMCCFCAGGALEPSGLSDAG